MSTTFIVGFILIQMTVFGIVIMVLRRLMYKDTQSAVNRLQLVDEENFRRIEEVKAKIKLAEEEYKRKIEQTAEDIRGQREKAKKEIEEERERIIARAREESDRIISGAKKLEARTGERREKDLETRATVSAQRMVRALFSGRMESCMDEQLVKELVEEIKALDAERLSVDFDKVEIISRAPLPSGQRSQIQKIMETKTGRKLEVKEEIKDDMIGGIILKLGSLIMDGSLESRIKEVGEELKKRSL